MIITTISIVLGFAAGFSLTYTLIRSFEKFEKTKFKSKRAKVNNEDLEELSSIDKEFAKESRNKKRKSLKIINTILITLLLLSTAFLALNNVEARIQVRCDGVREFPAPDDNSYRGDISLYDHWMHKYFEAPIRMRGTGRIASAEFNNEDCVYTEDPNFRWG